ncbi:MAG: hypothetical protein Q9195_001118 [Heterodermia aff. obscurata]
MTLQPSLDKPGLQPEDSVEAVIPCHPLGIKPLGNLYMARRNIKATAGLFYSIPDDLLIQILEFLEPLPLLRLGATCKALWAFSRHEDLWRAQYVKSPQKSNIWGGSWFHTVLNFPSKQPKLIIRCDNLFSDVLHRPFLCLRTPLSPFFRNIPRQNEIPRLDDLSAVQFASTWVNKPFILANAINKWPMHNGWSWRSFREKFKDVNFVAEAVDWALDAYLDYAGNNSDESPLYLFDHSFVEKMGLRIGKQPGEGDYWIPECFGDDFFSVFGDQRPDHRWLIIGPERSGSTFHKDPNATSAWNAVVWGLKYWIMFPTAPNFPPPPGVFVSKDESEVTSPVSLTEWLLGFHAEARKSKGCLEGLCYEGEVVHVPSGWWHLVVNVKPSFAITQNFVPRGHLSHALHFLKYKPEQVSGFKNDMQDPYGTFVARLREAHPEALEEALTEMYQLHGKKRKWDEVIENKTNGEDPGRPNHDQIGPTKSARFSEYGDGGALESIKAVESHFSFGFGCGDASDEEIP